MHKLRVFEGFAGIGSQHKSLSNIGVDFEVVAISEIDKNAIKSYEALHGSTRNVGDITLLKSEDIPEHDLFTYSFPCQSISTSGKMDGLAKGSGTKSSLLWDCENIIRTVKPRYLLMENVKNLVGTRFKDSFMQWVVLLDGLGYNSYYKVLDAVDYGIPQHRERVFMVSIQKEYDTGFNFPPKRETGKSLLDIIETPTFEGKIDKKIKPSVYKVFEEQYEDIIRCKDKSIYRCRCTAGYMEKVVGITVTPTLRNGNTLTSVLIGDKIKKISAKEAVLLTGFTESDYEKMLEVCSESMILKQCGNSIVVTILEDIFKAIFKQE